jgi:uncharacterized protein (DUF924 family)
MLDNRKDEILKYWFGHVEETVLPSQHRTEIWFSGKEEIDEEIKTQFSEDLEKAQRGEYNNWENDPRGSLALIVMYDQFSRHVYRNTIQAFAQDQKALDLCLQGIQKEFDHSLSLIERVFFYFPLMHAENVEMQATAVRAYQILVNLAFPETRALFESFLDYAVKHYDTIRRFGRFPQRNSVVGRPSTNEELEFLKTSQTQSD